MSASSNAGHAALDPTSPLAIFLSSVPQTSKQNLDFTSLDPYTFSVLLEAVNQATIEKAQDADLRLSLTSRNRALQTKLAKAEKDVAESHVQAEEAQRRETSAQSQTSAALAQCQSVESARKRTLGELDKVRKEALTVKCNARHLKIASERAVARQRERYNEAAILAAKTASPSQCVVLPGIFESCSLSTAESRAVGAPSSLYHEQIQELDAQRSALVFSNSALRRLLTEVVNAFNDVIAGVTEQAHGSDKGAPSRALQSELFPIGLPLRKGYDLNASAQSHAHPAVKAVGQAIKAADKALYDLDKTRRDMKQKMQTGTLRSSRSDTALCSDGHKQRDELPSAATHALAPRKVSRSLANDACRIQQLEQTLSAREDTARRLEAQLQEVRQETSAQLQEADSIVRDLREAKERAEQHLASAIVRNEELMRLAIVSRNAGGRDDDARGEMEAQAFPRDSGTDVSGVPQTKARRVGRDICDAILQAPAAQFVPEQPEARVDEPSPSMSPELVGSALKRSRPETSQTSATQENTWSSRDSDEGDVTGDGSKVVREGGVGAADGVSTTASVRNADSGQRATSQQQDSRQEDMPVKRQRREESTASAAKKPAAPAPLASRPMPNGTQMQRENAAISQTVSRTTDEAKRLVERQPKAGGRPVDQPGKIAKTTASQYPTSSTPATARRSRPLAEPSTVPEKITRTSQISGVKPPASSSTLQAALERRRKISKSAPSAAGQKEGAASRISGGAH